MLSMQSIIDKTKVLLFGREHSIAGIIPDVTLSEEHTDVLEVTSHPLGKGAPISDHAYLQPEEVEVSFGWSEASHTLNSLIQGSIFSNVTNLDDIYQALLDLQRSMKPFDLITGRRKYTDMLLTQLKVTHNDENDMALICNARFKKVNLVEVQTVAFDPDQQTQPAKTASTSDSGERKLQPATSVPKGVGA